MMHRRHFADAAAIFVLALAALLLLLTLLHRALGIVAVHAFDLHVTQKLHSLASPGLTVVMLAFTWLGAIRTFAPAVVFMGALLLWQRRHREAALLGLPILAALILNELLKLHFQRPRPLWPWSIPSFSVPAEHTFSFPSGHSFFAVVLYGTLAYSASHQGSSRHRVFTRVALALVLPLAIGSSRIYLGLHYPTDVLAGYLAGALLLLATILIDRRINLP